ncbi:CLUMA_CG006222, isoform A [Clunio marinus]|uniref:CLUMA_CG006222, isoform A n=1 Tax=Clunio marinus TaxID=568069 RepID=A0A1J1I337_9DIPT|nr:CLUMA_CG006222, isoform A [Clunio marinus]
MAAKEMLILFVYDLEHCRTEHDDPLLAIKYFHPSWVSDMQKLALCGQLMGLRNFCEQNFGDTSIISLQNGKFKIERFGRFILAIGTDRNIQESLLKYRADLMVNILRLYHQDIETIFSQFDGAKKFSDKLYHIFETYLPILQYNGNILQNVYKIFLPKSASNLYLDAIQILEHIASRNGILGGMILYNNKVLASQLSTTLTKTLTATDPVRIKTTAEVEKNVDFHIPMGSQIVKVYINLNDYNKLQKQIKKVDDAKSLDMQNSLPLPFNIKKKSKENLKRDKSLIFANIPEEEPLVDNRSPEKTRNFNRPNHLPLKFKAVQPKELPESGIASIISFDESDSFADFIGRTSVCATPMTENKILTGPMPTIFASAQATEIEIVEPASVNFVQRKKEKEIAQIFINYTSNPFKDVQWKKSYNDLNQITDLDESFSSEKVYNTIADPVFPIFTSKKLPLSKSLFDCYQQLYITDENFFEPPKVKNKTKMKPEPKIPEMDPMIVKDSPVDKKNSPNKVLRNQKKKMMRLPIKSFTLETDSGKPSTSSTSVTSNKNTSIFDSPSTKAKKYMGSLQLTPLMSKLTLLAMSENNENFSSAFGNRNNFDLPTPNICETPIDNNTRTLYNRLTKVDEEKHEVKDKNVETEMELTVMKRVDLFVCGQQNMTLMVIAEEDKISTDHRIVQSMFEICVNRLGRLEQKLNEIINVTVDLKTSDYSFINLDKQWDILKRGGAWQQNDLHTLLLMHESFEDKNISDIIIRTNDAILYGHNKSGESEIYYQHASQKQSSGGIPAPSDFTVISQAKRRLERDHSLVLF